MVRLNRNRSSNNRSRGFLEMHPTRSRPLRLKYLGNVGFIWLLCASSAVQSARSQEPGAEMFAKVAPIFVRHCLVCHNDQRAEGGYSISKIEELFRPGDSGLPPIDAPGGGKASEVLRRLTTKDKDERMPADARPLDDESIEIVRKWIQAKAPVTRARDRDLLQAMGATSVKELEQPVYLKPLPIRAIAVSDLGETVFTSGYREVLIWSNRGELQRRVPVSGRFVADIEYAPTLNRIYVSSGEPGQSGQVESIAIEGKSEQASNRLVHLRSLDVPADIAIHSSTARLAIGLGDGRLVVTDALSDTKVLDVAPHAAAITSVDWSEDGNVVYTGSRDRTAKSHGIDDGVVLGSYANHERTVSSVRSLSRGLVSYEETGRMQFFPEVNSSQSRASLDGLRPNNLKLSSNRELLVMPDQERVRQFRIVKDTVTETKETDGKVQESKKAKYRIQELDSFRFARSDGKDLPMCVAITAGSTTAIAAGFSNGEVLFWESVDQPPMQFLALPR